MKLLAKNKRAAFDYHLDERLVAGLQLTGAEVKSIKAGHASLRGSFIALRNNEAWLTNAQVTPYSSAPLKDYDPMRNRKLLLHRRQIDELIKQKQSGLSVVPTALLLEHNFVKIEIGVGRGKKRYDKRETIKQRDLVRELSRSRKL
jgi:SsrA-binding protein